MKLGLLFTPALILHFALSGLSAQTFSTFDQVDYVTVQDFSVFQEIWDKAENSNVRIAMFGDSQETIPGGAGAVYIPALNYEFYQHYGKVGESFASAGVGSFVGNWMLRGSFGSGTGNSLGTLSTQELVPATGSRVYNSSALGMATLLNTENTNLSDNSFLDSTDPLWDSADQVTATIFGVTRPVSGELAWRSVPTNDGINHFTAPMQTGVTSMGLQSDTRSILSEDTPVLNSNGMNRHQLIVRGDDTDGAELLGVRFNNLSTPGGVSVQSFSRGGYRLDSHLDNHSQAGQVLSAFGPYDAIIMHLGANDAYSGLGDSPQEFESNMRLFIDRIRSPQWLNNPDQKFILCTEAHRIGGPQNQRDAFDQYAGVLANFANNDPNIMAINSRRYTEEAGFDVDTASDFLIDIVHYNTRGALLMAQADYVLMRGGGLLGDLDFDGDVDVLGDAFTLIGNLGSTDADYSDGDINLDDTVSVLEDAFTLISNLGQTNQASE